MAATTPVIISHDTGTDYHLRDRFIAQKDDYSGDGSQVEAQWQILNAALTSIYWDSGLRPDTGNILQVFHGDTAPVSGEVRKVRCRVRNDEGTPVTSSWSASLTLTLGTAKPTRAQQREAQ